MEKLQKELAELKEVEKYIYDEMYSLSEGYEFNRLLEHQIKNDKEIDNKLQQIKQA